MKKILLFDIDATLTPPRQPINKEMTEILSNMTIPFAVAGGSDMELLKEQFFVPLYKNGFRKIFDAFISNGTMRYYCDYRKKMDIKLVFSFNMRKYLGEKNYKKIISALEEILEMKKFNLPKEIEIAPKKITDRISMINFIPMGRLQKEDPRAQENRRTFVEFSEKKDYRDKVIKHLKTRLAEVIREKKLKILLGGQTSFDLVIDGYDKTYPLYTLKKEGWDEIIFIGDALFPGGNDYVVQEYIDNWKEKGKCPYEAIKTKSWEDTIKILQEKNFRAL